MKNGLFYDVLDGNLFKNDQWIVSKENCLLILLFQDAVELCNPLGSRRVKHKTVMFYYTFVNIHPRLRSKLSSIKLLCCVPDKLLKKHGFLPVINQLNEELNVLYNGVEFLVDGELKMFYGKLILCLGDTLGQHEICGFKLGIGFSYQKCRECYITKNEILEKCYDELCSKRDLASHITQCKNIENAQSKALKDHLSTTYGIVSRSPLLDIEYFNLITQVPQDIMHVILEGVAQYDIRLIICHYIIDEKVFTLDEFNQALGSFNFGYTERRCKPERIHCSVISGSDGEKLKLNSENTRILCKVFPFILDYLHVNKNTEIYLFLMDMLSIIQISFSPVISEETVQYYKDLIANYLKSYAQLFPNCTLKPKHHFLVHLPNLILTSGPPLRSNCIRFEALHQFFTKAVRNINFKNLCKSLATRYQKDACSNYFDSIDESHSLFSSVRVEGPSKLLEEKEVNTLCQKYLLPPTTFIYSLNWVILYGTKYVTKQAYIAVDADSETEFPVFGLLLRILLLNEDVYFVYKPYVTVQFSSVFASFEVKDIDAEDICIASELLDFNVYHMVFSDDNSLFIPIKYDLSDIIREQLYGNNPLWGI